jgi:hypothetical protein
MVFSQTEIPSWLGGVLAPYVNASAVAVVLALVWYLVTKVQPRERREGQQHTEAVVSRICEQFAATQEHQHADNAEINRSIQALASNCAAHLQARKYTE